MAKASRSKVVQAHRESLEGTIRAAYDAYVQACEVKDRAKSTLDAYKHSLVMLDQAEEGVLENGSD